MKSVIHLPAVVFEVFITSRTIPVVSYFHDETGNIAVFDRVKENRQS